MRGIQVKRTFRCGHRRNKSNTGRAKSPTGGYQYCRTCAKARNDEWRKANRVVTRPPRPSRPPLDLSSDPDVQRYRQAAEERRARPNPQMEAARIAFAAELDRAKASRKGGRPKGSRNGASMDLSGLFSESA